MERLPWLEAVCHLEPCARAELASPVTMPPDLGGTVAACRWMMVWLDAATEYPPASAAALHLIRQAFERRGDARPLAMMPMEALRGWAGPCEQPRKCRCPECHGSRHVSCPTCDQDMECDLCDGTGEVLRLPAKRVGRIAGEPFDRQLLARLPVELAGQADVCLTAPGGTVWPIMLYLGGQGWRALVAGMAGVAGEDAPELLETLNHAPAA